MLIGTDGVYSYTFEHEKREDCPVCGGESLEISISRDWTVERLIEMLVEKQDMYALALVVIGWQLTINTSQTNQETIPVNPNETDLFSSTAAARTSDSAQPREEGVGTRRCRRRDHCYRIQSAVQLVLADQLRLNWIWELPIV